VVEVGLEESGFAAHLLQDGRIPHVGDCNEAYYAHYGVDRSRLFRSPFPVDETDCKLHWGKGRDYAEKSAEIWLPRGCSDGAHSR